MDPKTQNNDCYFFYYSTCTKGDRCTFRHEPSALGNETICSNWQQGNCLNKQCNLRHMDIKKNRKVIPCYWEKLPDGCKKPHCPFLHCHARATIANPITPVKATDVSEVKTINQDWTNRTGAKYHSINTETEPEPEQGCSSNDSSNYVNSTIGNHSFIVNFEEDSDSEEGTPTKRCKIASCKTEEEDRLEQIQKEMEDYYKYDPLDFAQEEGGGKIMPKVEIKAEQRIIKLNVKSDSARNLNFGIYSLEEIRRRKRERESLQNKSEELTDDTSLYNALNRLKKLTWEINKYTPIEAINEINKDQIVDVNQKESSQETDQVFQESPIQSENILDSYSVSAIQIQNNPTANKEKKSKINNSQNSENIQSNICDTNMNNQFSINSCKNSEINYTHSEEDMLQIDISVSEQNIENVACS